jgi:AcrR family transcriptional regulator
MSSVRSRSDPVKKARAYDASGRQARASRTRERIVATAERMFLRNGYTATTITAVAAEAGVSPDTIYKGFGGKAGLVRAIRTEALQGVGSVSAEQRSDDLHATTSDANVIVEEWGRLIAEVAPLVAPILLLIRTAAASDPAAQILMEEMDADRLVRMSENAQRLHEAGHLRRGLSVHDATDVLWTYSAPELYELLVLRRGWTPQRFGRFAADAMIDALL